MLSRAAVCAAGSFTESVLYLMFSVRDHVVHTRYDVVDTMREVIGRAIVHGQVGIVSVSSLLTDTGVKGYYSVPGDRVDWVVVKKELRSTALTLTDRVQRDLWLLVGIVLIGFLLIEIVIQRGPIQSIQQLATQANTIAEGDLTVDIDHGNRID